MTEIEMLENVARASICKLRPPTYESEHARVALARSGATVLELIERVRKAEAETKTTIDSGNVLVAALVKADAELRKQKSINDALYTESMKNIDDHAAENAKLRAVADAARIERGIFYSDVMKSTDALFNAVQRGVYDSRSVVGDETLRLKGALEQFKTFALAALDAPKEDGK